MSTMKELLASVADEGVIMGRTNLLEVLERRLLPLLEAGHEIYMDEYDGTAGHSRYDAALAAAKKRQP